MSQNFMPGDFLVFQLEAGFALLRVLAIDVLADETIWHLAGYSEFYLDVESAEAALERSAELKLSSEHMALTNRAFESTQVARLTNVPIEEIELQRLDDWRRDPEREVSDRSVRLMLGLR